MNVTDLNLQGGELRRLLGAANADAALLYLYLQAGNDCNHAESELKLSQSRVNGAMAMLRQLDLWQEKKATPVMGERPNYSERDIMQAMDTDGAFRCLCDDVQRRLGRVLNAEEMKVLLAMVRYLGLPEEVICLLVSYCQERARQKGSLRNPSLRSIEKEAYVWAEQGIDTMKEAAAYIQQKNIQRSRMGVLMNKLQIRGRRLTPAEAKYAAAWLDMGMEDALFDMAYERTCLNTGGMNWQYMNKILTSWHQAGLHTVEEVRTGDRKKGTKSGHRDLDAEELAAIQRMMKEQ